MNNFYILPGKPEEFAQCSSIFDKAFNINDAYSRKRLEKFCSALLKQKLAKFLLGKLNDKIVCFGALILHDKTSYVAFMSVLPSLQGQGIGRKLFSRIVREANDLDYQTIELYATTAGQRVYEKEGFQSNFNASMFQIKDAKIKLDRSQVIKFNRLQPWIMDLDQNATGINRIPFLSAVCQTEGFAIGIENKGFAIISANRIGPVIAINPEIAANIIIRGKQLGAENIIIPEMNNQLSQLDKYISLEKKKNRTCLKMLKGENLSTNRQLIYGLHSFASG